MNNNAHHLVDRNVYGAVELGGLGNPQAYHAIERKETHCWTTPGIKVTRLRLVTDRGFPFWDVSYCHGELNGKPCRVGLPFNQIPKREGLKRFIVKEAIRAGVHAQKIGLLDNISTLV
jgi:hypothetical protein